MQNYQANDSSNNSYIIREQNQTNEETGYLLINIITNKIKSN